MKKKNHKSFDKKCWKFLLFFCNFPSPLADAMNLRSSRENSWKHFFLFLYPTCGPDHLFVHFAPEFVRFDVEIYKYGPSGFLYVCQRTGGKKRSLSYFCSRCLALAYSIFIDIWNLYVGSRIGILVVTAESSSRSSAALE